MIKAKIYTIGEHIGTVRELAVVVGIQPANMDRRIKKFLAGKYTAEKCMAEGSLSRAIPEDYGNNEWNLLSGKIKDARLSIDQVPDKWAEYGI